ncbi:MAG: hypothetical protein H6562_23225 [Lewinellaceae bacterium]|nr:hypothetical protein [Lewinellaceae bacterium]
MKQLIAVLTSAGLIALIACHRDPSDNWKKLDLLEYGLPITVYAPDSAVVRSKKMGFVQDVTVKKGDFYSIQILSSAARTNDISSLKAEQLDLVRDSRYFSKVVEETEDGFIYQNNIEGAECFGFRYVFVQGDMEYVLASGYADIFKLEEIKEMFDAVRRR